MKVTQIGAENLLDFAVFYSDGSGTAPVVHCGVKEMKDAEGTRLRAGGIMEIAPPYLGSRIRFFALTAKKTPQGKHVLNGHMLTE